MVSINCMSISPNIQHLSSEHKQNSGYNKMTFRTTFHPQYGQKRYMCSLNNIGNEEYKCPLYSNLII